MRASRFVLVWALFAASPAFAADGALSPREIYEGACASCHGNDGRGAPDSGVNVPLPDFSDCRMVTAENDGNWHYLLLHGGQSFGLSSQMPAFEGILSSEQIDQVIDYIRSFCTDASWPHGDLNFRRALITSKAFPEDEFLIKPEFEKGRDRTRDWVTEMSLERRVGRRGQVEVSLPFAAHDITHGPTTAGLGDVTLAYTHVLYANRFSATIVAAALDLGLPTGDYHRNLGAGTVNFGPSLLLGQRLGPIVFQGQIRGDAPIDENRADRSVSYNLAFSYPFSSIKRDWVPTVEIEALQDVSTSQHHLFITPEIYKGLTRRGHVAVALGAQIPVAGDADPFDVRVLAFFLWEYSDGGLWW
ncbi:MAG TPA: c-type cytochrome [Candidatus Acidoferrales bacterium]|nr:c-type cytochrome [Candidatus Acidoferrales bacterium]